MFRLYDKNTGLYAHHGDPIKWAEHGTIYQKLSTLQIKITYHLCKMVSAEIHRRYNDVVLLNQQNPSIQNQNNVLNFYKRPDIQALLELKKRQNKKHLYEAFLPENWEIRKIVTFVEENIDIMEKLSNV